jgi:hypothetical protein
MPPQAAGDVGDTSSREDSSFISSCASCWTEVGRDRLEVRSSVFTRGGREAGGTPGGDRAGDAACIDLKILVRGPVSAEGGEGDMTRRRTSGMWKRGCSTEFK